MRQDRGRRDFRPRSIAPVKVGDELDVNIEAVGEKGDGIAKINGFVLFVPGTKVGEKVRLRVTRVLQKVGFAEVIGQSTAEGSEQEQEQETSQEQESAEQEPEEEYSAEDSEDFGEEEEK